MAERANEFADLAVGLLDDPKAALRDAGEMGIDPDFLADIKRHGVRQALKVRPNGERYEVLTGHRRLTHARAAKLKTVPCIIVHHQDIPVEAERWAENRFRQNLNPASEAQVLDAMLAEDCGGDVEKLCDITGLLDGYVQNRLGLLKGDPDVFAALKEGRITIAVAQILNKYPKPHYRAMRLADAVSQGWTWRQAHAAYHDDLKIIRAAGDVTPVDGETPVDPPLPATYRLECMCCAGTDNPHMMEVHHVHTYCKQILRRHYAAAQERSLA